VRLMCAILTAAVMGCGGCDGGSPTTKDIFWWGGAGRTNGKFFKPRGIAIADGRVYVVDMTGRIQVFGPDGRWLATWRLEQINRGYPSGLGVRPDGCLGVADTHNFRVLIYTPAGERVQVIGREGGGEGEFTYVTDVAFDADGNVFVSEHGRVPRVQKFDKAGRFVKMWGASGDQPGAFIRPQGLAVDRGGSVYVADASAHRIQKFSGDGVLQAVIGEPGHGPGQVMYPYDVAVLPNGNLAVCEYGNNRVQVFDREGASLGTWGGPGREPGQFATPWGLAPLAGRGLYVTDRGNHRVQVLPVPVGGEGA